MCNERGYCWATNEQLGRGLGIASRTVSALVSQLAGRDLIRVQVIRDPDTNEVVERRIWMLMPKIRIEDVDTPHAKNGDTLTQKQAIPHAQNGAEKNKDNYIPPKAPQGGRRSRREVKVAPDWKPERFAGFWEFYRTHCRGESKQAAIRAWDRLKPDDSLINRMGRALQHQIQSQDWQAGIGIPYASTWLNNLRWEDEPKAAEGCREPEPQPQGEWL